MAGKNNFDRVFRKTNHDLDGNFGRVTSSKAEVDQLYTVPRWSDAQNIFWLLQHETSFWPLLGRDFSIKAEGRDYGKRSEWGKQIA